MGEHCRVCKIAKKLSKVAKGAAATSQRDQAAAQHASDGETLAGTVNWLFWTVSRPLRAAVARKAEANDYGDGELPMFSASTRLGRKLSPP